MKKIVSLILVSILSASIFAGCGLEDPLSVNNGQSPTTADSTVANETEPQKPVKENYEKSYEGLVEYFKDLEYIDTEEKSVTKMSADLIGAKQGNRYAKDTAKVELYEFGGKDNDKAADIKRAVEKNGKFELYNREVEAYLSDNGKYLMIYTDTAIGEGDTTSDAYKTKKAAIKTFKSFE